MSTCSTLLALVNVDSSPVIQFSHFSVKEFLTSSRFGEKCDTISHRYHISLTPTHTLVAQACLGILLHLGEDITRDRLQEYPLAEYAAMHWVEHARFDVVSQTVDEGMKQLFDAGKPHLGIWRWIREAIGTPVVIEQEERPLPPLSTPLQYASSCGLHTVVKFLVTGHSRDGHSRGVTEGTTALQLASREGHVEVACILVEHGADVTAKDDSGETPLHQASSARCVDLAQFLVENGANATAEDNWGRTPLHLASRVGSLDLARLLVGHGANVTAQNEEGSTPLHEAAEMGIVDLARFLVEHGASVTVQDMHGWTPLHRASQWFKVNTDFT